MKPKRNKRINYSALFLSHLIFADNGKLDAKALCLRLLNNKLRRFNHERECLLSRELVSCSHNTRPTKVIIITYHNTTGA